MIRPGILLPLLLALSGCVPGPAAPPAVTDAACRWRPDGGPPLADRGIGGTGAPSRLTDRGIGGTGIIGFVSGFASVCVDGQEIAYDPNVPVEIDGSAADPDALRVGQVVAISANPAATRILVRHEVSGPVEAVLDAEAGLIVVAGQRVRVSSSALGEASIQPGAWVAVSGLRSGEGTVIASRIDPRQPGPVSVRGSLITSDGKAWIGNLAVRARGGFDDRGGTYVFVSGTYSDGLLDVNAIMPDLLVSNPPAFFGAGTKQIAMASYVRFSGDTARLTGGFDVGFAPGFVPPNDGRGLMVITLEAQPSGAFAVAGVRVAPPVAPGAGAMMGSKGAGSAASAPALARPAISPGTSLPSAGGGSGRPALGSAMGGAARGGAQAAPAGTGTPGFGGGRFGRAGFGGAGAGSGGFKPRR